MRPSCRRYRYALHCHLSRLVTQEQKVFEGSHLMEMFLVTGDDTILRSKGQRQSHKTMQSSDTMWLVTQEWKVQIGVNVLC